MSSTIASRVTALAAFTGAAALLAGTLLHPSHAHPNEALHAFAEYAADQHWIASHLLQLAGALLLFGALVLFARRFRSDAGQVTARVGLYLAVVSAATVVALQAVDGIALRAMTVTWATAASADRPALFAATLAVRQIEIGFAAMFALLGGLTMVMFSLALMLDRPAGPRAQRGLGGLGLLGGVATLAGGLAMAYTGFSDTAMLINMPANVGLLLWAVLLGAWLWRQADAW